MKKKFFAVMLAAAGFTTVSNAQTYKPFKVDVSGGATASFGDIGDSPLLAVEPKYAINDKVSIGFRLEDAVAFSSAVTTDYYFNNVSKNNKLRLFVGAGIGIYNFRDEVFNHSDGYDNSYSSSEDHFGSVIRGGFEYAHFRMGLEYNGVAGNSNSYLALKAGFCIGGGRKKK